MKKYWSYIHELFLALITAKAFNGVVEIIGGFFILFYGKAVELEVYAFTNFELTERHNEFISKYLIESARSFSISAQHFVSIYLLFHGVLNLLLVFLIYKKKILAYPLSMILFGLFLIYQIIRVYHNHSIGLAVISVVDVFMIILTWFEYQRLRKKLII